YRCTRLPDKQAASTATDAPPDQMIHRARTQSQRCSQSEREDSSFQTPCLRRLLQLSVLPVPVLPRGCDRERSRGGGPNTPHKAPVRIPVLREKPRQTYDET